GMRIDRVARVVCGDRTGVVVLEVLLAAALEVGLRIRRHRARPRESRCTREEDRASEAEAHPDREAPAAPRAREERAPGTRATARRTSSGSQVRPRGARCACA